MANRYDVEKVRAASALNAMGEKFRAMRDARIKMEQDNELFALTKKQKMLELKTMEMNPAIDPGLVAMKKRNLKLRLQSEENRLKINQKTLDYQLSDTAKQMQTVGEKIGHINRLTEQYGNILGDTMTVLNLQTGQVELKQKDYSDKRVESEILKNESYAQKNYVDAARAMATDADGQIDQEKFEKYLESLSSSIGSASSGDYSLNQIISHGGKKYKVVGLDDPTDPDLEEIQ